MKYALIIACNYNNDLSGGNASLYHGSTANARNIYDLLTQQYHYAPEDVTILCDEIVYENKPQDMPTNRNIYRELTNLFCNTEKACEITLYYSGHGTHIDTNIFNSLILDLSNSAGIVPIDSDTHGCIPDTVLYGLVQLSVCPTLIMTDCCYSGSMFALPYSKQWDPSSTQLIPFKNDRAYFWNQNIVMLSSTMNSAVGWFVYDDGIQSFRGAFTEALMAALKERNYQGDIRDIFIALSQWIHAHGHQQKPVLSSSSLDSPWIFGQEIQQKLPAIPPSSILDPIIAPITPIVVPITSDDCCHDHGACCSIQ